MGVLRTKGVVACMGSEKIWVGGGESVIKGKLDSRGYGLAIKVWEGAFVKGGWVTIWTDDRLPITCITTKKVICILPVAKELGFGCDEGGGREREDDVLLLLWEGVDPRHAWESGPLDGVPVGVSVMATIGIKEGGK